MQHVSNGRAGRVLGPPLAAVLLAMAAGLSPELALLGGWLLLVPIERWFLEAPQSSPSVVELPDALRVRLPLRGRVGPIGLVGAVLLSGIWAFRMLSGPAGQVTFAGAFGLLLLMSAVGVGLTWLSSSTALIRVDAAKRRLSVRWSALRKAELVLGEVARVRAVPSGLVVEHTGGELAIPAGYLPAAELADLAGELDRYARKHGADPDASRLRHQARSDLADVGTRGKALQREPEH